MSARPFTGIAAEFGQPLTLPYAPLLLKRKPCIKSPLVLRLCKKIIFLQKQLIVRTKRELFGRDTQNRLVMSCYFTIQRVAKLLRMISTCHSCCYWPSNYRRFGISISLLLERTPNSAFVLPKYRMGHPDNYLYS